MCSSLCMVDMSSTRLTLAAVRACYNMMNMPYDPYTAGMILRRRTRRRIHFRNENLCLDDGISLKVSHTLATLDSGKRRSCASIPRSQPRMVFLVDQADSPLCNFLREMGYL